MMELKRTIAQEESLNFYKYIIINQDFLGGPTDYENTSHH